MRTPALLFALLGTATCSHLEQRAPQEQDTGSVLGSVIEAGSSGGDSGVGGAVTPGGSPHVHPSGMDMSGMPGMPGMQMPGMQMPGMAPAVAAAPNATFNQAAKEIFMGQLGDFVSAIPSLEVADNATLTPVLSPSNKRFKVRYGPFDLVASGAARPDGFLPSISPDSQAFLRVVRGGIPSNASLLIVKSNLEFKDGSPANLTNSIYIHNFLTADVSKPGILPVAPCEADEATGQMDSPWSSINGIPGSGMTGQGNDFVASPVYFTTQDGKFDSGYYTGDQDDFTFMLDVANAAPTPQTVYLVLDMEYKDGRAGSDAANQLLTVNGCRHVRPNPSDSGPTKTDSRDFPVLVDGSIVHARGHLHNGGTSIRLTLNGRQICESTPDYGTIAVAGGNSGTGIKSMSACGETPIPVKKGDKLAIEAVYDLTVRRVAGPGGADAQGMFDITFAVPGVNKKDW